MDSKSGNFFDYTPYKNRWIALVRQRVVGVGEKAERAYRGAKMNCPKDRPVLFFIDEFAMAHQQPHNFDVWFEQKLIKEIVRIFHRQKQEAYLVGGAVRDGLLGAPDKSGDLDLLVPKNALTVARMLADELGAAFYPVDAGRDVGRVVLPEGDYIDVASYRGVSLLEDLHNRDFTINAIALSLNLEAYRIIDPLSGQADLEQQLIRVVSDTTIKNDPLRSVRGVRQAFDLDFSLTLETELLIMAQTEAIDQASPERLRDELLKLMQVKTPGQAIDALRKLGLLPRILPEVMTMVGVEQSPPHHLPVFEHSLLAMDNWAALSNLLTTLKPRTESAKGVDWDDSQLAPLEPVKAQLQAYFQSRLAGNLSRASLMPLVALLHDVGKPATFNRGADGRIRFWRHPQVGAGIAREILDRWRFSGQGARFVSAIVKNHLRPLLLARQGSVSKRALHRFLEATGDAAPAIAIFSLLDHLAIYKPGEGQLEWAQLLNVALQICRAYFAPKIPILLTGKDIIAHLNIPPGPKIGALLKKLKEAQAVEEVTTREEALSFISREGAREARR